MLEIRAGIQNKNVKENLELVTEFRYIQNGQTRIRRHGSENPTWPGDMVSGILKEDSKTKPYLEGLKPPIADPICRGEKHITSPLVRT